MTTTNSQALTWDALASAAAPKFEELEIEGYGTILIKKPTDYEMSEISSCIREGNDKAGFYKSRRKAFCLLAHNPDQTRMLGDDDTDKVKDLPAEIVTMFYEKYLGVKDVKSLLAEVRRQKKD